MIRIKEFEISIDEILDKYSNMVYRLAFSRTKNIYDSQDITQDVFLKLISLNRDFNSFEHLKAWLLRVTINCSKNLLTTAWFRKTVGIEDNIVVHLKEKSEVYKYVLNLPKKYRTVIHLFYYEDLKTNEIAKILDIKESTIRSQLKRARELLKKNMKGDKFDVF